jgi:hypothetical protein
VALVAVVLLLAEVLRQRLEGTKSTLLRLAEHLPLQMAAATLSI